MHVKCRACHYNCNYTNICSFHINFGKNIISHKHIYITTSKQIWQQTLTAKGSIHTQTIAENKDISSRFWWSQGMGGLKIFEKALRSLWTTPYVYKFQTINTKANISELIFLRLFVSECVCLLNRKQRNKYHLHFFAAPEAHDNQSEEQSFAKIKF